MPTAKYPVTVSLMRPGTNMARVIFRCRTVRQAEKFIAEREKRDPDGVHRGDYGVDATEKAHAAYQRLRNRNV